jgi:hypothetical protein
MLFSPVYIEAHPRRNAAFASRMNLRDAAHAAPRTSSISSNSFASYSFRTLASHLKPTVSSNSFAIKSFRTLCKIPGIGYPPPSILFSTPQPRVRAGNARSLGINSCICHTSEKSLSKSFHSHTSKIIGLKALCLPHIRENGGCPPSLDGLTSGARRRR